MSASPQFQNTVLTRRTIFMAGWILLTASAEVLLLRSQSHLPLFWPNYVIFVLFPILFSQLSIGFVLGLFGFYDWVRGGDPHHLMRRPWIEQEASIPVAATAIVIPVFNEDMERVSRGIRSMWKSLRATGQIEHFDFFLCSDTNVADNWVAEECTWLHLCQELNAFGKFFYRKRHHAINGKSGNVADFCRRWGKSYRYMILLDADSVMSGPTMVRMVRAMEANVSLGILQTQPAMVLGRSLFRRLMQFAHSVYGGVFSRGASMALLSSSSYWGHNAILRLAPFMEHCALPAVPAPTRRERHILSHDTVEALLMQRAGYEVWVAPLEFGSYEEGPPNLSDMLKRDRRWCAGNLQHFWFLWARGVELSGRLGVWLGLMSYLCSPFWLAFIIMGFVASADQARFLRLSAGPEEIGTHHHHELIALSILTGIMLFLPRLLGLVSILPRRAAAFGGRAKLLISAGLETLFSVFLAPVLMLFHTLFVFQITFGWQTTWTAQNRNDQGLTWDHCLALYGWQTGLGIIGLALGYSYLGDSFGWLLPICIPWMVAPLTAWISSSTDLGSTCRQKGWFVIPQEAQAPAELQNLSGEEPKNGGLASPLWSQALFSPYFLGLHLSMVRQRGGAEQVASVSPEIIAERRRIVQQGPTSLQSVDQMHLLWDADSLFWLHHELWATPRQDRHPEWELAQRDCLHNELLRRWDDLD